MSADLLRRAAAVLREHAQALPPPFIGESWRVVVTDSESVSGVAACPEHTVDPFTACDSCTDIETWHEGTAAFIRLMGPPVALALADLLDAHAKFVDDAVAWKIDAPAEVIAVARAILREPQS